MVSFKENLTLENHETAFNIANKRLLKNKIIWAAVFAVMLVVFLILAITQKMETYVYIILGVLAVVVIYVNFFHDLVLYKVKHKELKRLLEDAESITYLEIDFNSEHVALTDPLSPKRNIIRIDYDRLAQVYYDSANNCLFFLEKGDSQFYFALFLENHPKQSIIEMIETFANPIINEDLLRDYLGQDINRPIFVSDDSDDVIRDSGTKEEDNKE